MADDILLDLRDLRVRFGPVRAVDFTFPGLAILLTALRSTCSRRPARRARSATGAHPVNGEAGDP